jgi:L-alanine-DL-glutamate epimerase-like enolase superfamily enzyme
VSDDWHWTVDRHSLPLEDAFTISRGTTETTENVVVRLERDGIEGVGCAAPAAHYGETADTVESVLPRLFAAAEAADYPHRIEEIERSLGAAVGGNPAARAAVSIAVHDWVCRDLDVPLYRYWGLSPGGAVDTSFTVGIDDTDRMVERAEAAVGRGHSILKLKLGTDRDREIVTRIREALPGVRIRVDANEAWGPKEALAHCDVLADHDVEFVEQPVPASDREGQRYVYEHSPLPVAADESLIDPTDVPAIAGRADVANLKLMKSGGLRAARETIAAARAHGLDVMLGCMVESSASIAAAAHLAPLLDYADLDGSLLLAADPFEGPVREDGSIDLGERPGTGVREIGVE